MRRGLVRTAKVLGFTLALTVVLSAVAPSARATWTPRRDMLGWMNNARNQAINAEKVCPPSSR